MAATQPAFQRYECFWAVCVLAHIESNSTLWATRMYKFWSPGLSNGNLTSRTEGCSRYFVQGCRGRPRTSSLFDETGGPMSVECGIKPPSTRPHRRSGYPASRSRATFCIYREATAIISSGTDCGVRSDPSLNRWSQCCRVRIDFSSKSMQQSYPVHERKTLSFAKGKNTPSLS